MIMRKKLIFSVCFLFFLSACASTAEHERVETITYAPSAAPTESTNTSMIIQTITPVPEECWRTVVISDYENRPSFPLSISEGVEESLWVLYHNRLQQILSDGTIKLYNFRDFFDCGKCLEIANGSMAVSEAGDVWIGLPTGILIVEENGNWRHLEINEITPLGNEKSDLQVLLSDKKGDIWVSQDNTLCFYDDIAWHCNTLNELTWESHLVEGTTQADDIISATSGQGNQIWFGTEYGRIILYDGEGFIVENLNEAIDAQEPIRRIRSMDFDEETGFLWAISSTISSCIDITFNELNSAVFQRDSEGNWLSFAKKLFVAPPYHSSGCGHEVTSIVVTKESKVWLGIRHQFGLAYYDGLSWKTLRDEPLPYIQNGQTSNIVSACDIPLSDWVTDLLITRAGKLVMANQLGVFEYIGSNITD